MTLAENLVIVLTAILVGVISLTAIVSSVTTVTNPTAITNESLDSYGENTVANTPLHAVTSVYRYPSLTAYTDYIATIASNLINLNTTQAATLELVAPHAEATGYWSFNVNNSTDTVDDANGLNNGTIYNATWTESGQYGGAYVFDSEDNDYIEVADSEALNLTIPFTIAAWINPVSIGEEMQIVSKGTGATRNYEFLVKTSGRVELGAWNGTTDILEAVSEDIIATGEWTYVIGVFNGTHGQTYINGEINGNSAANTSGLVTTSATLRIGHLNGYPTAVYFNGTIDEVRIYNRSLSQAEITELYNTYDNTSVYKADYTYEQAGYTEGTSSTILTFLPVIFAVLLLVGAIGVLGIKQ